MNVSFIEIQFGTPAFDESIALRDKILRQPLGLSFKESDIEQEYAQVHLAGYSPSGEMVAILVLMPNEDGVAKMRQVAIDDACQGMGIGKALVEFSEIWAKENGVKTITMSARETAVPFYQKLGYTKTGRRFKEVTIPHYKMHKDLL